MSNYPDNFRGFPDELYPSAPIVKTRSKEWKAEQARRRAFHVANHKAALARAAKRGEAA